MTRLARWPPSQPPWTAGFHSSGLPGPASCPLVAFQTRENTAAAANVCRLLLSCWQDLNYFQETTTFTYFYFFKVARGEIVLRRPWGAKARFYWNHFTDKLEITGYWFHWTELRIYDKSQYVIFKLNVTELSPFFFFESQHQILFCLWQGKIIETVLYYSYNTVLNSMKRNQFTI